MISKKYLIVIVGPTAIGKTSKAIEVAQNYNCEILSCDSRQFYKEMSIGTAVPSKEELSAVKHHFIHNKSIGDKYTVGDFERDAIQKLDLLYATSDFAVMVGGSGLYVEAVLFGMDEFPEIDPSIRVEIQNNYQNLGITYLQENLQKLDADQFEVIEKGNPQRLMRALEVCLQTGKPYSSFLTKNTKKRNFIPIIIGLEADRSLIYERINRRVDIMIEDGLLAEVKSLQNFKEINALQTVGYKELFAFLTDEYSWDFAVETIKRNTRRYAKRQLTWFKKNEYTKWFNYNESSKTIFDYIDSKKTETEI
ncbi:tRNA (adenosine(37)-N6)-dimethylallyltransferase MiaA [Flavobacterium ardleyense]|uniref:tRNA (adenosine(37)-N6)-dimethylallyltransferase MiaA n=1 Tax=Flavobacterium ardleyense TaxID=2038737 RepID=UPI00298CF6FD|nr:tRNA (adenosine(37)-N6)-dimethylallyltransferase MiaA [Flavobacterium ardleyense]